METLIANDAFSDNNVLYASFTTNISGNGQYINTFGDVNDDLWLTKTLGSAGELWKINVPIFTKFNNVFTNYYTTNPRGNYTDETTGYLISPCYDLSILENPMLKFDMVFDIELDWDVLYMEYALDSGETWDILGNANDPNWYNSSFIDPQRPITVGKQWTGTDSTIKEYSYNLSSFNNETSIIFRFVFASDQAENGEGAAIDNFTIDASAILAVDD
ncbi:MAG: T9SS type A sorting domain-containing protein, partial [Candidatus Heimdallarchaeota archaeon]